LQAFFVYLVGHT